MTRSLGVFLVHTHEGRVGNPDLVAASRAQASQPVHLGLCVQFQHLSLSMLPRQQFRDGGDGTTP
eukprot:1158397-Pelagomonas_calceolata.AAC.9